MRRLRLSDEDIGELDHQSDESSQMGKDDAKKKVKQSIPHVDMVEFLKNADMDKEELLSFTLDMAKITSEALDLASLQEQLDLLVLGYQMKDAPYLVLKQIALHLPLKQISGFCRMNTNFAQVCNSQDFWKEKLYEDYHLTTRFAAGMSWKASYKMAHNNPPQGRVTIITTTDDDEYHFDFFTADDELRGCEKVRFFIRTLFPDFDTTRIDGIMFHGSRGYPVVAKYEAMLTNGITFFSINPELVVFLSPSQETFIRVEFFGNVVLDVLQEMYGEETYSEWLQACGYAIEDSPFPHPMQLYELSKEENYKIISEMLDAILQMQVL